MKRLMASCARFGRNEGNGSGRGRRSAGLHQGLLWLVVLTAALWTAPRVEAGVVSSCASVGLAISCTGSLDTPEDVFLESFTLTSTEYLEIQTYGFGGGTNAAGATISPGGFDSLVALFSGSAHNATVLTDGGGNPIVSSDTLSQFSPGCPPAGTVTVGTVPGVCGDNQLIVPSLGPGMYTLLLSDANFTPLAVNPGIPGAFDLTDTSSMNYGSPSGNGAYTDLSGGVFQTCVSFTDCNADSGSFAVDIFAYPNAPIATPEPGLSVLVGAGLGVVFVVRRRTFVRNTRSGQRGRASAQDCVGRLDG